jgi:hypothetical protein
VLRSSKAGSERRGNGWPAWPAVGFMHARLCSRLGNCSILPVDALKIEEAVDKIARRTG